MCIRDRWKGEDEKITKTESGELGSAVSAYIRRIQQNRDIVPSFDTFYEYCLLYTSPRCWLPTGGCWQAAASPN